MRHAKGYSAYAKQDGLKAHDLSIWVVDGVACCGTCTYPLAGKFVRVELPHGTTDVLLRELRAWGVCRTNFTINDSILVTNDDDIFDVVFETLKAYPLKIEVLTPSVRSSENDPNDRKGQPFTPTNPYS